MIIQVEAENEKYQQETVRLIVVADRSSFHLFSPELSPREN